MIGSSDVACILGLSPWGGPWSVWCRLVGLTSYDTGSTMDTEDGHMLEAGIGARYAKEHGLKVGASLLPGPSITEPSIPHLTEKWAGCRPDFLRLDALAPDKGSRWPWAERVVECKAPREWSDAWGEPGTDVVPMHYAIQVLWQMEVCELDSADLCAYARYERRDRWRVYHLNDRPALRAAIVDRARDWHEQYVVTKTPPPIDGSADCAEGLGLVYDKPAPKVYRNATPEDLAIARDLQRVRTVIRDMKARKVECENILRASIGDAYGLIDGTDPKVDAVATWGPKKGATTIDGARLRKELPEIAAQYTKVGAVSRSFRFPFSKGDDDDGE